MKNIVRYYYAATPEQQKAGMTWYFNASQECRALAKRTNLSINKVCAIVAALSPNQSWKLNFQSAERLIAGLQAGVNDYTKIPHVCAYNKNKAKAVRIYESKNSREFLTILHSPKVSAFYKNLVNPGCKETVTIDGHAFNIFYNSRKLLKNAIRCTPAKAERITSAYQKAGRMLSILPSQVQAVTWVVWREKHKIKNN